MDIKFKINLNISEKMKILNYSSMFSQKGHWGGGEVIISEHETVSEISIPKKNGHQN